MPRKKVAKKPTRKRGRPSDYTPKIAAAICEKLAGGESLRSVCDEPDMPGRTTVLRWLRAHEEFRIEYAHAREDQAEGYADEIMEIADELKQEPTQEKVAAARVRIDTRKWVAVKLLPKKYGERQQLEHTGKDGGPIELTTDELRHKIAGRISGIASRIGASGDPGGVDAGGAGGA